MIPESEVAWLLAEAAGPCLAGYQRTMAFAEIGGGETRLAIERILTVVAQTGFALPAGTIAGIDYWLDCYVDGPEERRLRKLLASTRSDSTEEPAITPPPARWVQIVDVNPRVIARHSPPITCPVPQVAASIRDWFPHAGAAVHDTIDALQHTLCSGGYADQLAALLHLVVEPIAE